MDTRIFDYEISVTNITKDYIELLASRIHRNMIRKLRSLNSKSVYPLILALSLLAVIFAAQQQQQQQQVKAQGPFDQGYAQGTDDAKSNNERNNTCPSDLDHGACFLFQQGYNLGYTDEKFLHGNDRPRTQDDGEFQDNN